MNRSTRSVALLVAACFFMEMLDGTIVITAAPSIGESLGVPATSISLVITAYLVTVSALIPLSGWLSGRYGARPVFLAAITIFTLASIGCAASQDLLQLVSMRILQGAGGAMMVPVGRFVVLAETPKEDLMKATAYLIWPALIAPVLAPLAGGFITTYASWHWIFLVNVPLGALAFVFALRLVQSPPAPEPPKLDITGVALTCASLAGLTYSAQLLGEGSGDLVLAATLGSASILVATIAVRHLLRARDPLIDLRTLRIATFGASIGGSALFFLVVGAGPFVYPLLFQEGLGWSPVKSGAVVLFIFAGNIAIKPVTTLLFGRFGFRAVLAAATAGMAAALSASAFFTSSTPLVMIAVIVCISGIARSLGGTGYTTMALVDVPDHQMRNASTLQATTQTLGLGLGVAAGAVALRVAIPIGEVLPGEIGVDDKFAVAFFLLAALSLVATAGALRLDSSAGDVLRRKRKSRSAQLDLH